jgi:hypothetical protein
VKSGPKGIFSAVIYAFVFSLAVACPGRAQVATSQGDVPALQTQVFDSRSAPDAGTTDLPAAGDTDSQPAKKSTPQNASHVVESDWHLDIAPYLWFPGVHGSVGGPRGEASVHASAADLLSHFRFGLMGFADLRYKRVLMPVELMWVRLGDDAALPGPSLLAISANVKASEFLLTPKVGYRVIDREKIKIDALTGFRFWHLGQSLQFNPSLLGLTFSGSQNWVDPLVGGRILAALSPKATITIAGDVGGWGAGSQLDYQIVGVLGYQIKPKWTLMAGYRYLDVNYRSGQVFDVAMSGVVFGVNIAVK